MSKRLPWIRLYRDALHNPKIVTLSDRLHRAWHNCLLIADDGGSLPSLRDVAVHMRTTVPEAEHLILDLVDAGLIDADMLKGARTYRLHDWSKHQFPSDNSSSRVRKYRARKRRETGVKRYSHAIDTDTDTDTDTDIRSYPGSEQPIEGTYTRGGVA